MKQLGTNSSDSSKPTNNSEAPVIDLDSSDDDNMKKGGDDVVLPGGFLDPLPPKYAAQKCKNFWKAGDFEQGYDGNWDTLSDGCGCEQMRKEMLLFICKFAGTLFTVYNFLIYFEIGCELTCEWNKFAGTLFTVYNFLIYFESDCDLTCESK
ncbi:hypothetical protein HanOQP8_Chr05g0196911 [Helianthus annuus]|nr:hypothetical protein HanOQP8_Chr05g0196911 [Helianthus annuus]